MLNMRIFAGTGFKNGNFGLSMDELSSGKDNHRTMKWLKSVHGPRSTVHGILHKRAYFPEPKDINSM